MLACVVSQPYSDYPRYLHQLSKQTRRGEVSDISSQVNMLRCRAVFAAVPAAVWRRFCVLTRNLQEVVLMMVWNALQVKVVSTSLHHLMDDIEQGERAALVRQAEIAKMLQEVRQDMQENMASLRGDIDKVFESIEASSRPRSRALEPQPEPEPEPERKTATSQ